MNELGALLRELREKESLREVSNRSGISHSYLGLIEKGVDLRSGKPIKPTPETLRILSKAYNYSYEELMKKAGYIHEANEMYHVAALDPSSKGLPVDLEKALQEGPVKYRGRLLAESECKKLLDIATILFRE